MPNWADVEYYIEGSSEDIKKIEEAWDKAETINGDKWLISFAEEFGFTEEEVSTDNMRAFLSSDLDLSYDDEDGSIGFALQSAWSGNEDFFERLNKKKFDGRLSVSYRCMEPGNIVYYAHDEANAFPEECVVNYGGDTFGDVYCEASSYADAIEYWCECMNQKQGSRSTQEMVDYINDYEYDEGFDEDTFYSINPIEFE
jgi:hypothetical protein